jgi:hypothetical protein
VCSGANPTWQPSLLQVAVRCFNGSDQARYTDVHAWAFDPTTQLFDPDPQPQDTNFSALMSGCGDDYIVAARWILGTTEVQAQCSPGGDLVPTCQSPTPEDLVDLGDRLRLYSMISPQGPFGSTSACFPSGGTDHSWIEARSAAPRRAYHAVLAGRYVCVRPMGAIDTLSACDQPPPTSGPPDCYGGTCGLGACPAGTCGLATGVDLAPQSYFALEINGDDTFDNCCDNETDAESANACAPFDEDCSPLDVQCTTAAIFGSCDDGTCTSPEAQFKSFDRVVWLGPVQDIDTGDSPADTTPGDLQNACLRFSFRYFGGSPRILPHAFGPADVLPDDDDGCAISGGPERRDDDFDGVHDECDPGVGNHSPADGFSRFTLRDKIRHEGFPAPFQETPSGNLVTVEGVQATVLEADADYLVVEVPPLSLLGSLDIFWRKQTEAPPPGDFAQQPFVPTWYGYVSDGTPGGVLVFDSAGELTIDGNVSRTNSYVNLACDPAVTPASAPIDFAVRPVEKPGPQELFADREVFAIAEVASGTPPVTGSRLFGFRVEDHRLIQAGPYDAGVPVPDPARALAVAEDGPEGTGTWHAYVAWRFQENFGKISRIDIDDPADEASWGDSAHSIFPYTGEPMGLEAAFSDPKVYAYVTSVSCHGEDGGEGPMGAGPQFWCEEDCAGGGPPPPRRVLYLTVIDVTNPASMTEVVRHEIAATEPPCSERAALENFGLAFNEDRSRLLVANPDGDNLTVVRTSDFVVEARIALPPGSQPVDVAVVRPGGTQPETAYVVEQGDGRVRIIDIGTLSLLPASIDLNPGGPPLAAVAIAASSDGKRLFTADSTQRTVSVVDIDPDSETKNTKRKELHTGPDATRLVLLRLPPPPP